MTACDVRQSASQYAYVCIGGRVRLAHRAAYVAAHGTTFEAIHGLVVRHKCDNPRCVNPEHLELGTQQDNINDKVERNRQAKGSSHGMVELTEEAVRYIKANYKRRHKEFGGRALAARFGVHESTVSDLMLGHTWRHV